MTILLVVADRTSITQQKTRLATMTVGTSMLASSSSSLHLNFPPSAGAGVLNSRSLSGVQVHPVALFSILDHYLRRSDNDDVDEATVGEDGTNETSGAQQTRVIGTLLGTRNGSEIEIKSCFAVPHRESVEQVQVDMEYHKTMCDLHLRVNPDEIIVGWYATGPELNMYTSLIQDFYSRETAPHQAIHLTVDPDVRSDMGVRAYVSAPVGLSVKPENAVFVPLPVSLLSAPSERPSLALMARVQGGGLQGSTVAGGSGVMPHDLDALAASLESVQAQLRRVLQYVREVLQGKRAGDPVVGRYVIDAVSTVPIAATVDKSGASNGASDLETLFNSHLQDVLMVSYLANVVRAQAEIAGRLTVLT